MPIIQNRRCFLAGLSSVAAAGLVDAPKVLSEEEPLETTRIRLYDWTGLCIAPQFVAEELLKGEGFTDVQYLRDEASGGALPNPLLASGAIDINSQFSAPSIIRVEAGDPVVFLGGLHVGCFELFGTEKIRAVRDLKGKRVAIPRDHAAEVLRPRSVDGAVEDHMADLLRPKLLRDWGKVQ